MPLVAPVITATLPSSFPTSTPFDRWFRCYVHRSECLTYRVGAGGRKLCTPVGTDLGYARPMTELEKGPRGLRRGRGARERILSASRQLFRDQGINCTGMDQLCAVAEVSKRTLYQHFPGKDELIAEHLRRFDPDILPEVFDRADLTPADDFSPPSAPPPRTPPRRLRHRPAAVSVHRSGRRDPRPRPPGTRLRPRLQEGPCRAAHGDRPRGRRHQPRTARRATGAAPGWRRGSQPGPRHLDVLHRRRHRSG